MPWLTRKRAFLFAILIYLVCVGLSVWMLGLRKSAIQFHTRDYNYFVEQAVRLADPNLRDWFTINVEGYNILGMIGSEGATSIFQAIHTEYFRYTYTAIYWLFGSTWALYLFFSAIFFFPVLYVGALPRPKANPACTPAVLLILLYVLYPASFPSAIGDMRSRFLFSTAWILMGLAVYYDRPFFEKLVFFLFLLSIREEGIILGGMMIVFNIFRTRPEHRLKQTLVLAALDGLAVGAFVWFMHWTGYFDSIGSFLPIDIPKRWLLFLFSRRGLVSLIAMGVGATGLAWLAYRRYPKQTALTVSAAIYSAAVLLPATQTIHEGAKWFAVQGGVTLGSVLRIGEYLADPFGALTVYMLFLVAILLVERLQGRWQKLFTRGLAALAVLFLVMTLQTLPATVRQYQQETVQARLVWEFKNTLDPYRSGVLVDYNTLQAFYDFNDVIVYQRLPLWLTHPQQRYYPDNRNELAQLIREKLSYAVISVDSRGDVESAAQLSGVLVEQISANERYQVLKFLK